MEGKGLETDLRNWARVMGVVPEGNASEIFRKLCSNERKAVWERVIREIRPIYEVEHIQKNLALKKMSQKVKLRQKLAEKEEEIQIREQDFEWAHQKLQVLNCKMQAIKQRTKDLGMKTLLLRCKKQDLEKEAERYEQLCQVADFFQRPVITVSGEAHSSCMKDVETSCQNAVCECKAQILELHKLYKMKNVNMQTLYSNKESVMEFVHYHMKDFPILNIWHTLLNSIDRLNEELHNLTQSDVRKESEHLQAVKECFDSEMKKFMKSHLELFAAHHNLQHKINQIGSERGVLLDRTVELLQEMCEREHGEIFQEPGKIRQWLELQIKLTELGVIKKTLQTEIKNLKLSTNPSSLEVLSFQEKETESLRKEIERLQAEVRTNYMWLAKSLAGQIETEEKLKQEITKLSQICALDKCGMTTLDESVNGLQGAFQHELKEFMALPLHFLDNITLSSGSVLPSSQQILKYHNNLISMDQLHDATDMLTVLEGFPSAAPHGVVLHMLEKKWYLNFLNTTEVNTDELFPSLAVLDISSVKNADNATTTAVTEIMNVTEKAMEECKVVAVRAEDNYRVWLEHPLRHAVPESLQINEKNFQQWQSEYDSLLTTLIDLESGKGVSHMI